MKLPAGLDDRLDREIEARLAGGRLPASYRGALDEPRSEMAGPAFRGAAAAQRGSAAFRTIVLVHRRPALLVQDDAFEAPESEEWSALLEPHRAALEATLPAVGRIELLSHPTLAWVGTGFLVASDVIVTNRHVASEFVERGGSGLRWRAFSGVEVGSAVDFRAEHGASSPAAFALTDILHVEGDGGPDIALFRVAGADGREPLILGGDGTTGQAVATIGHPGEERVYSPDVAAAMRRIFGGIYEVKRLAPGRLTRVEGGTLAHDCSTLAGNSGSAVVDLESGQVVGLHYHGGFAENLAVAATTVADRLAAV